MERSRSTDRAAARLPALEPRRRDPRRGPPDRAVSPHLYYNEGYIAEMLLGQFPTLDSS